jgi:hypothetical protein
MTNLSCAQCKSFDIREKTVYFGRNSELLGEWPLYYWGAGPHNPQDAEAYFCCAQCANDWVKERRDATQG